MIHVKRVIESGPVIRFRLARDLLGRPYYHTAAYWVDGLLVDTGCAHTASELVGALSDWPVEQIVNTHSHEDHIGANAEIQHRFGCPIYAHKGGLPILADPRLQPLQPYRRLFWGWPHASLSQAIGERVTTQRFSFDVIHTPGHSPDHVCLFEPQQGWLFTGDAYIGGHDRALRAGYNILGILASLRRLAELPVTVIFPASGTVRESGTQPLEEKIVYLDDLGEKIRSLAQLGLSARQIRRRIFGREVALAYLTLGHFSGMHLVDSYLNPET